MNDEIKNLHSELSALDNEKIRQAFFYVFGWLTSTCENKEVTSAYLVAVRRAMKSKSVEEIIAENANTSPLAYPNSSKGSNQ